LKALSEHIPRSSAAGFASELKIKSYSTLKIDHSSTAGSFNCTAAIVDFVIINFFA